MEYTIKNEFLQVVVDDFGARIVQLISLKSGKNLVLPYQENHLHHYVNCIVGRNAGRIANAEIEIDGNKVPLSKNFANKHQLHGGFNNFSFKNYELITYKQDEITFKTISPHLEEGFPGTVSFTITYQLIENELHFIYHGISDQKTLMNFTNHTYFNLTGDPHETILEHELTLNAKEVLLLNEEMIPSKRISVINTPFDFTKRKKISEHFSFDEADLKKTKGYDHPFVITQPKPLNHIATLEYKGVILDVYSDQELVVLYTGNYLKREYTGICLETQGNPNWDVMEKNCIYDAYNPYKQHTIYKMTE